MHISASVAADTRHETEFVEGVTCVCVCPREGCEGRIAPLWKRTGQRAENKSISREAGSCEKLNRIYTRCRVLFHRGRADGRMRVSRSGQTFLAPFQPN